MAYVVAQDVPTSSTMAVLHGPVGVSEARRRIRGQLLASGVPEDIVEDAVLVLSELLSNSCRHARPLGTGATLPPGAPPVPPGDFSRDYVRASWSHEPTGELTVSVTDGGGPTRPFPATPSVSARGGRGLSIVTSLSQEWGVVEGAEQGDGCPDVTVWAMLGPASGRAGARSEEGRSGRDDTPLDLDLIGVDPLL